MADDILIVDDEADIRMAIGGLLEDEGYKTRAVGDSDSTLAEIDSSRPDLLILDVWLQNSKLDGMQLLHFITKAHPGLPVVIISGHGTIELAVKAIQVGAYDFIEKPFKSDRMLLIVRRALEAAKLRSENEELRLQVDTAQEFVGVSPWAAQVRQAINKVAPTGSRILITGPAGSGKEVVARQIHQSSRRPDGPFVVMNCATMHPDRFEAELFGVAPGVDGNDQAGRIGTFERAHSGTLLLDEVADMPFETQGKIVRVLQDQSFHRVAGDRRIGVNVRVIASTNRDLPGLIGEGRFREDLYYRLNVVPLAVPPLSDHREDIPELCVLFMKRASLATGVPERRLDIDAISALQAYNWPGNTRQLRNVIDWILIMAPGGPNDPVRAEHLPTEIGMENPATLVGRRQEEVMSLPLRDAREVFERRYLEAQVHRFSGNISRTATFVGMERSALHRKLRSLGISANDRN